MRDVTCEVLVATDVAQRGLDIKNAGSSVACCDNMCSQAELANVGPHSKVQFVVNYDAPANMEERCGNIGWHIDLFGLTSDIFHVNVLYTVILHFGVLGTICHRIFFRAEQQPFLQDYVHRIGRTGRAGEKGLVAAVAHSAVAVVAVVSCRWCLHLSVWVRERVSWCNKGQ